MLDIVTKAVAWIISGVPLYSVTRISDRPYSFCENRDTEFLLLQEERNPVRKNPKQILIFYRFGDALDPEVHGCPSCATVFNKTRHSGEHCLHCIFFFFSLTFFFTIFYVVSVQFRAMATQFPSSSLLPSLLSPSTSIYGANIKHPSKKVLSSTSRSSHTPSSSQTSFVYFSL